MPTDDARIHPSTAGAPAGRSTAPTAAAGSRPFESLRASPRLLRHTIAHLFGPRQISSRRSLGIDRHIQYYRSHRGARAPLGSTTRRTTRARGPVHKGAQHTSHTTQAHARTARRAQHGSAHADGHTHTHARTRRVGAHDRGGRIARSSHYVHSKSYLRLGLSPPMRGCPPRPPSNHDLTSEPLLIPTSGDGGGRRAGTHTGH